VSLSGDYEQIGVGYAAGRQADPRWAQVITAAIGDATSVINVGAGSGSYEPAGVTRLAVEPSPTMITQRSAGLAPAVRGVSEVLPVRSASFDVALAVLTVHHWTDWRAGVIELGRVARRQVILTFDPTVMRDFWLVRDYFPEAADLDLRRTPGLVELAAALGESTMTALLVPVDCADGVMPAYWRRPEAYLDPRVRQCASGLAQLHPSVIDRGTQQLAEDLRSGAWQERNADLLELDAYDAGFRLIHASQAGRRPS
jgi:SAM-dependent methyltransferase